MNDPIHICIITSVHPIDDVRVNHKIGQAFRGNGFRVTWVGPNHAFFDSNSYNKYGIKYELFFPSRGKIGRVFNTIKLFWHALRVKSVDVYYIPDPDVAAFAIRMSRKKKARIIFDIHEMFHGVMLDRWVKGGLAKIVSKILHRQLLKVCSKCDLVIGVSQAVMMPYEKVIKEKMEIRSCAPAWFAKDPPSEICGKSRIYFTFYHGKANPSQGTGVVLKALELARWQFRNIKCIMFDTFAGSVKELKAFEKQVTELSLGEHLELRHGIPMQEVPAVLRECDAGLIAYGKELGIDSLPNKLFEYMAAGLPIIAPIYSTEICRIIRTEKCGLAIDFEDPIAVADAMVWFCENPVEVREMGRRARIAFDERNNWEAEVRPLIERIKSWFV